MRTVIGSTDHVVVIGAGLAGLSTALHLAGRGRMVTLLERGATAGGRIGRADRGGYRMDTGATVLTMPELLDDVFAAVGESTRDRLTLTRLDPAYRAYFAGGEHLDVFTDTDRMVDSVVDFAGVEAAAGYLRLRSWLARLYAAEFDGFVAANFDSPLSLLTPALARLTALGGFGNWESAVARFIDDPRLRRVFTFQSLYAGVAPQSARAAYAVIAYMDTIGGVYFPSGGMRAVPDALAAAAADAGVKIHYRTAVTGIERNGARAQAVRTEHDERIECDAVVLTTELQRAYQLLGHRSRRPLGLRAAPSALIAHLASAPLDDAVAHHTISFGDAWTETFRDVIDRGRTMRDPSLLITRPTATDPSLAPAGRELLSVLAPTPNLDRGEIDWRRIGSDYTEQLLDVVRDRLIPGLDAEILELITPADWADQDMIAGSPFALAHTFAQTGPFRPANMIKGLDNVVLAGGSTVPGVGIPPTLISGRLAADRITGSTGNP